MKVISVRQPWAHLIIHHGKDIENRTRPTKYRGPLLIHASKGIDMGGYRFVRANCPELKGSGFMIEHKERGGFIGIVDLVDCVEAHPSPWFQGPFGYVLENPRAIEFVPYKGQLGLFNADYHPPKGTPA